jgi:hypothetical protein
MAHYHSCMVDTIEWYRDLHNFVACKLELGNILINTVYRITHRNHYQ